MVVPPNAFALPGDEGFEDDRAGLNMGTGDDMVAENSSEEEETKGYNESSNRGGRKRKTLEDRVNSNSSGGSSSSSSDKSDTDIDAATPYPCLRSSKQLGEVVSMLL